MFECGLCFGRRLPGRLAFRVRHLVFGDDLGVACVKLGVLLTGLARGRLDRGLAQILARSIPLEVIVGKLRISEDLFALVGSNCFRQRLIHLLEVNSP